MDSVVRQRNHSTVMLVSSIAYWLVCINTVHSVRPATGGT